MCSKGGSKKFEAKNTLGPFSTTPSVLDRAIETLRRLLQEHQGNISTRVMEGQLATAGFSSATIGRARDHLRDNGEIRTFQFGGAHFLEGRTLFAAQVLTMRRLSFAEEPKALPWSRNSGKLRHAQLQGAQSSLVNRPHMSNFQGF